MGEDTASDALRDVYGAESREALAAAYARWAPTYEAELAAMGYRLADLGAGFLARHAPTLEARLLDAGCGAGSVGEALATLGYRDLTGVDMSAEMLAQARAKGVYAALEVAVLGEPLPFVDAAFDAAIAIGCFGDGHAPASSLDELARVTRPGGVVAFNLLERVVGPRGFAARMDALAEQGLWRLAQLSPPFRVFARTEPDLLTRLYAFERL